MTQPMKGKVKVTPRWKMLGPLVVIVALALGTSSCGSGGTTPEATGSSSAEPQRGGELVMGINSDLQSLDAASCASTYFQHCAPIYGTLLRFNTETKKFEAGMASSFESTDGKIWTLKLREGVKFSDGTPFDAEAVAFNWARIKDPATLSPAARTAAPLTWTVIDPLTLEVKLAEPNFQLQWALTEGLGMIASPAAIKKLGPDFGSAPVGAGPFVLKKWTRGSEAQYTANEDYWEKGLPYLDSFVLKVIGQDDQRLNALRTGQIDIDWSLLDKDAAKMKTEGYVVHSLPLVTGTGMLFNYKDPDLKDPDLRLALLKTFDAAQINNAVYPGSEPADAFLSKDSTYRQGSDGKFPEKDLPGAQKLFDAYLAKTGKSSLKLTFTNYAGIPALEQVGQILQSQVQQIKGLTVEIKAIDAAAFVGTVRSGEYQLALGSTPSAQSLDGLYEFFHTKGSSNTAGYSNPVVDKAFDASRASEDPKVVQEAYKLIHNEISEDAPLRSYRYKTGFLFTSKKVNGLVPAGYFSGLAAYLERAWVTK